MKMDKKTKIIIGVLAVVVVILSCFAIYVLSMNWVGGQQQVAYAVGYQDGEKYTVQSIIQQSRNCQPVPLTLSNQTFTFVDIDECGLRGNATG